MKRSKKKNSNRSKLLLLCGTIIAFIFLIEFISYLATNKSHISNEELKIIDSKDFAYSSINNNQSYLPGIDTIRRVSKQFVNGTIIYNTTQSREKYGRRIFGQIYKINNPHVILFGCSFVNGDGLNDNETLSYFLYKEIPEYNIYNYGISGSGPQKMLDLLKSNKLPQEVFSSKGYFFYVFTNIHIYRAIGSTVSPDTIRKYTALNKDENWFSYIINRNGTLEKIDSSDEIIRIRNLVYRIFLLIKQHSYFLRLNNIDLPFNSVKKGAELTYKIIAASKSEYEKQFNGTFYVVLHPISGDIETQNLIQLLKKNNISYIYYSINGSLDEYEIPQDLHPNAKLNRLLAERLAQFIENKDNSSSKTIYT